MEVFLDFVHEFGLFFKESLHNKWSPLIGFVIGFTPAVWIAWKSRRSWKKSSMVGELDVDFQLTFFATLNNGMETLEVLSVEDTTLDKLIPNRHGRDLVIHHCLKATPFLDMGDVDGQRLVNNAVLKRISTVGNRRSGFRRAVGKPTTVYSYIFGLAKEKGGLQNQYRVVIVPEKLLHELATEPDTRLGSDHLHVPEHLSFRFQTLREMRDIYRNQKGTQKPLILGQVNVCLEE